MPTIDVEGIGELEFPDDMTDDQIEAAIKEHPQYEAVMNNPEHHLWTKAKLTAQGIPIAGQFVNDSPQMANYKENYPIRAGLLNTAGGMASTLPLAGGMASVVGTKLIPSLFAQGGLHGALAWGDKEAEDAAKGTKSSWDEKARHAGFNTIFGAAGPAAAKFLSPGMTKAGASELAKWGLGGYGAGHLVANPMLTALLGAGYRSVASNKVLNNPTSHAMLSTLFGGMGREMDPETAKLAASMMSGTVPFTYGTD